MKPTNYKLHIIESDYYITIFSMDPSDFLPVLLNELFKISG